MGKGQYSGGGDSSTVVIAGPARAQVRAVAFKIKNNVYEGRTGETHGTLYTRLLLDRLVPAKRLDLWTAHEEDHGFVTKTGEFLSRAEAFKRFGITHSQDLTAQDLPNG
jgi:hypothetical protein